jgi:hypothetical protein
MEYLANITDAVNRDEPWEQSAPNLRPKKKNLPQRYHEFLDGAAEGYYRGLWKPE